MPLFKRALFQQRHGARTSGLVSVPNEYPKEHVNTGEMQRFGKECIKKEERENEEFELSP